MAAVLIVSDRPNLVEELRPALEALGHPVVGVAGGGTSACAMLDACRPGLLILDAALSADVPPDGLAGLAVRLRGEAGRPLLLAGTPAGRPEADRLAAAGACGPLPLPARPGELAFAVAAALQASARLRALQEREELYRRLAENARDVLFRLSLPDGRCEYVSPAVLALTGHPPRDFYRMPDLYRRLIAPAWREDFERRWRQMLAGEIVDEYEVAIRHISGEERWLRQRGVLLRGADGRPVALEAIATDVTARRAAEERSRRLEEQLLEARKLEAVGRLAGGIAHDFNNLLTCVLGCADLLRRDPALPERQASFAREIHTAAERGAELVRRLLLFSRKLPFSPQPVDLAARVEGLLAPLRRLVGPDIRLEIDLSRGAPAVQADPLLVDQVVLNLADNARNAMPQGGALALQVREVRLEGERAGLYVRLTARDTGVGMDERTRRRLFEPFFTTREPGRGTGLGLAMVHGIVESCGGFLRVDSAPGKGSAFEVWLPALPDGRGDCPGPPDSVILGGEERCD